MTRAKDRDREDAVLRAKVTLTQAQLAAIIQTLNDGPWRQHWQELPHGAVTVWLPLEQVGLEYVVARADGPLAVAFCDEHLGMDRRVVFEKGNAQRSVSRHL